MQTPLICEAVELLIHCPTLNRNFVHPILVAFPSVTEQQQIIEVLNVHDTRIYTEEAYLDKLKLQKK